MAARLTIVSHASTRAIRDASFPLDEPLDGDGEAKAQALVASIRRVDVAWTGPELRARQTASALGLDAVVDAALRDIELGRWAGRLFDDVSATEPEAAATWIGNPGAAPHGGESITDLLERLRPWLELLRMRHERFVAISHPAVIRAVVILSLDADPASFWRIDVAPLCRVNLSGNASGWTLRSFGS
jgi:broad specificity phosphatase PhoE